jgi:hypothetical protein
MCVADGSSSSGPYNRGSPWARRHLPPGTCELSEHLAVDWATISSLATAAGTLVLAIATFSAVRSSNRSARIAEVALQEQRRPLLAPSRLEDPKQTIMFLEGNWVSAAGGRAAVVHLDGIVYLAISLRNVGSGIAVCQGWAVRPGPASSRTSLTNAAIDTHTPVEEFRLQSRDLYVPAGDISMWQGALRNPDDPVRAGIAEAIDIGQSVTVELLYSDQVGRQRTISRLGLVPKYDMWLASLNRHWYLDWDGPRPDELQVAAAEVELQVAAAEVVLRDRDAALERRAVLENEHPLADDKGGPSDDQPGLPPSAPEQPRVAPTVEG